MKTTYVIFNGYIVLDFSLHCVHSSKFWSCLFHQRSFWHLVVWRKTSKFLNIRDVYSAFEDPFLPATLHAWNRYKTYMFVITKPTIFARWAFPIFFFLNENKLINKGLFIDSFYWKFSLLLKQWSVIPIKRLSVVINCTATLYFYIVRIEIIETFKFVCSGVTVAIKINTRLIKLHSRMLGHSSLMVLSWKR